MEKEIDNFFERDSKWAEEFRLLREIILAHNVLNETFKWMHPCYTLADKNVVLIHGFKNYCALLFHKGALLSNNDGLLIQQTKHVQAARQIRFTQVEQIEAQRNAIDAYLNEAIAIEKLGKKVILKKVSDYPMPEELNNAFSENEDFEKSFYTLSPGRQKGYLFYFNQAKQSKTRLARIEIYYEHILSGKGMDDQ